MLGIVKIFGKTVTRTPNLLLENRVVLSLPLSFIFEKGFLKRDRKNIWHDSDSNPEPTAREPCYPKPTAVIYF